MSDFPLAMWPVGTLLVLQFSDVLRRRDCGRAQEPAPSGSVSVKETEDNPYSAELVSRDVQYHHARIIYHLITRKSDPIIRLTDVEDRFAKTVELPAQTSIKEDITNTDNGVVPGFRVTKTGGKPWTNYRCVQRLGAC